MDDKEKAILRFKALMQYAASSDDDVGDEIQRQERLLETLGVPPGDISNLIHDRHGRSTPEVAAMVKEIEAERRMRRRAFGAYPSYADRPPPPPREKTKEELAAEYLRATGREPGKARTSNPVPPSFPAVTKMLPEAVRPPRQAHQPALTKAALKVPYGLDSNGRLTHANYAIRVASYCCPSCKAPLVLREGDHKAKHFAHKADTECTGESVLHDTAKRLIAQVIDQHINAHAPVISLECTCSECNKRFSKKLRTDVFSGAAIEQRVGEFVCDVVASKAGTPALAIEVCHTNAVNASKSDALSVPWIELDATAVLENPRYWRPLQGRTKPVTCESCKKKQDEIRRVAARWKLALPGSPYRAATAPCWHCKEQILWFWWPGVPFAQSQPPQPIPRTVQYRHSKQFGGKYWMNVCPGCNLPQGDNFVFLADDSPFKGMEMRYTDEMKAQQAANNRTAVDAFMAVVKKNFGD